MCQRTDLTLRINELTWFFVSTNQLHSFCQRANFTLLVNEPTWLFMSTSQLHSFGQRTDLTLRVNEPTSLFETTNRLFEHVKLSQSAYACISTSAATSLRVKLSQSAHDCTSKSAIIIAISWYWYNNYQRHHLKAHMKYLSVIPIRGVQINVIFGKKLIHLEPCPF